MLDRYKIDRSYYKRCLQTANRIKSFIEEVMDDRDLMQDILKTNGLEELKTDMFGQYNYRVVIFVMYDVWKCYVGMGYDDQDVEQQAMLSFSMAQFILIKGNSSSRLANGILSEDIRELEALQGVGKQMMSVERVLDPKGFEDPDAFLMMLYYDRQHRGQKEYLQFLYEVSECMASANGNIPCRAKAYLDKLKQKVSTYEEPSRQQMKTASAEVSKDESKQSGLSELDDLIGLGIVKTEIRKLRSFEKVQQLRIKEGLKVPEVSHHCVFTGNPGTGKTTVARILAKIYKELGLLRKGHLIETDRSGLVAEYVGQTAVKTNKIIDSALDGVLFIDEAYSLVMEGGGEFGHEAVAALLKRMEDDRDRLIVILAGYGEEMKRFVESNPGLKSRFKRHLYFEDYDTDELMEIFQSLVKKHDYIVDEDAKGKVRDIVDEAVKNRDRHFGNARFVRNLFEKIVENQAMRLAEQGLTDKASLQQILHRDI